MTGKLANAPIVEAVLDIDCDMPPALDLATIEGGALTTFQSRYPTLRRRFLEEHRLEGAAEQPPKVSIRRGLHALQLFDGDERQLIQIRAQGYSFNRLAPYSSLDDYLPEIERTFGLFLTLTGPLQIRAVRLRYINRLLLPCGVARADRYLQVPACLPTGPALDFEGFLHHYVATTPDGGHRIKVVLASQPSSTDQGGLPVIFDITTQADGSIEPADWGAVEGRIKSLRALKNTIFTSTLTTECLQLFQA